MNNIQLTKNKKEPQITIITISMNNVSGLSETILSVTNQDYPNKQFIVIDGNSKDETELLLTQKKPLIDKALIESDVGVYHAMNKGISLSDGEWIIYMNSGDVFAGNDILSNIAKELDDNVDVLYSDWCYFNSSKTVKASIEKLNVRHQSVVYRRALHETYGNYLVGNGVSISDYLFFLSVRHLKWKYFATPISICDRNGLSAKPSHLYQRILSECIFGMRSRFSTAAILILYPMYRFFKRSIFRKS